MTDGEEEMKASIHNQEAAEYRKFYRDTLFNDVMPFWMRSDLIDRKYGGYISSVDRYGINDDFKVAAELGKTFLENKCFDKDGRMFFTVTRDGKPLRKHRYMFSEGFYVV